MANDKFERIEKKFWMTREQMDQMFPILKQHMEVDQYGLSKIRNIYCDSDDYMLIRKSIEHPKFKEKLRIRSYSDFQDDAKVFVEIKRKIKGVGYKRRVEMPFAQAMELLDGKMPPVENPQIEKELHEFVNRYHPQPKVYLTYERMALYGKEDPFLRVTIDQKIRYRIYKKGMDFEKEGHPVISDETRSLMEIKAPGYIPKWLVDALSELHIYQSSFSKIGETFTRHIAPELNFGHKSVAEKAKIPSEDEAALHNPIPFRKHHAKRYSVL